MGKGVMMSDASAKIAKKRGKKMQGMTSGCCSTKVPLRPKVYITDVADFRRLVQDLTSNCNPFSRFPSPGSLDTMSADSDAVSRSEESRVLDDFEEFLGWEDNASGFFSMDLPSCGPQQISVYEQQKQMLNLGDIESWLLETDSVAPSWENYVPDISSNDYITGDSMKDQLSYNIKRSNY